MVRHLAAQVEDWPGLQRELRELRTRATELTEQLGATMAAYDALYAEQEQWAEQARSLEVSKVEVAHLRGRVAELEGSGPAPSGEESRRAAALEARNQQLDSEVAALRLKATELEELQQRAEGVVETLKAQALADVVARQQEDIARASAQAEEEVRWRKALRDAAREAVLRFVRSSRMGSWVGFYQKHARETSTLPADQVPLPPPYVCPEAGTFIDDGDNPLDAWEESIPGEIRLAEGFSLGDLPDPCRLESSRKRKRGNESSGGASR